MTLLKFGPLAQTINSSKDMILIGLGSSLPWAGRQPPEILRAAVRVLERLFTVMAVSDLYGSPAWPDQEDPPFVNAVVKAETAMTPGAVLTALHAIEAGFGRRRRAANAPRTLDLDLLDHGGRVSVCRVSGLALPHPRIEERDFVLVPLREVAPDWRHPATGFSVDHLLDSLAIRAVRRIDG